MLEAVAQRGPLASGGFECDLDPIGGRSLQDPLQGGRDPVDAPGLAGPHVGSRVSDQMAQAQPLAAIHFVEKGGDGPFPELVLGRRQIDQVGVMGHHLEDGGFGPALPELVDLRIEQDPAPPLVVVLDEDLEDVAADVHGPVEGLGDSTRNRHVGAQKGVLLVRHGSQGSRVENLRKDRRIDFHSSVPAVHHRYAGVRRLESRRPRIGARKDAACLFK